MQNKLMEYGKLAIDLWGEPAQIFMIVEECAELILAIQKGLRNNFKDTDNICEEIADVEILLSQARLIFNSETIDKYKEFKLNRLGERLKIGTNL